jgi:hypothetical protein
LGYPLGLLIGEKSLPARVFPKVEGQASGLGPWSPPDVKAKLGTPRPLTGSSIRLQQHPPLFSSSRFHATVGPDQVPLRSMWVLGGKWELGFQADL